MIELHGKDNPQQDTAAIREASASLLSAPWTFNVAAIRLSGSFAIDEPLVLGTHETLPIALLADHYAIIKWVGERINSPMLTFRGTGRSRVCLLRGVTLNCLRKTRGVLFDGCQHQRLADSSLVLFPRQIGIEATNCWGSSIVNSEVAAGVGVGFRASNWNTAWLQQCRFLTFGCHHRSWDAERNMELWRCEVADGRDAALAKYANDYVDDWPTGERAVVDVHGSNWLATGLNFEQSRPCEYPLISINGSTTEINGMRVENVSTRNSRIRLCGGGAFGNHAVRIGRVEGGCGDHPAGHCRSFLEIAGKSVDVTIHDSVMHGLGGQVVAAGEQSTINVIGVTSLANKVPDFNPIPTALGQ